MTDRSRHVPETLHKAWFLWNAQTELFFTGNVALGALLRRSWGVLKPSWDAFGRSWDTLGTSWDSLGALLDASWGVLETSWETYRKNVEGDTVLGLILGSKMEGEINKNRTKRQTHFLVFFFPLSNWCFICCWKVGTWKISISPAREHDFYKIHIFRKMRKKC